jgi:hypothetical protein
MSWGFWGRLWLFIVAMPLHSLIRRWIVLAPAVFVAGSTALAGTMTWTGTGNWTNASNWGGAVPGAGDTAIIPSGTVTVTGSVQVLILSNAGTLTFSGWGTVLTASNVIVGAAGTVNHTAQGFFGGFSNRVQFVCTNLTVSGTINVTGCGYAGGTNDGYGTNGVSTPGSGKILGSGAGGGAGMAARAAMAIITRRR